ncbi:hypothetical protein OG898_10085 [Streptomyces sp. NBC_00193]|uniref:hypothetical protein n=1 Tax=Streptomyces sp. NBC_00193 TaxID=2975675 RepID=UPI00224DEB54|nr:hypothetical protein [Streptomyces sp. NBC_00193]MCX5296838.1 hypothetical protein [Streptomyces sp. NBC_00193]
MLSPAPQGSHMYVLTLQNQHGNICTLSGTFTPDPGTTRHDVHQQLREDAVRRYPSLENATVVFFSLESNHL